MKKNILIVVLALVALTVSSCKKEETLCNQPFKGYMEGSNGKTHLVSDNNLNLKWDAPFTEEILVLAQHGSDDNMYYTSGTFQNTEVTEGGTKAYFALPADGSINCLEGDHFIAYYPNGYCNYTTETVNTGEQEWRWNSRHTYRQGTDGRWYYTQNGQTIYVYEGDPHYGSYRDITATATTVESMTIPYTQYFTDLSMRKFPMRGESVGDDRELQFHNLAGGLDLFLQDAGVNVTRIEITTDDQQLSGNFQINGPYTGDNDNLNRDWHYIQTSTISSSSITSENQNDNKINFVCATNEDPDGVDISNGEHFYIAMPVGQYNSFNVVIYTDDGRCAVRKMTLNSGATLDIERSKLTPISFRQGDLPFREVPGIVPNGKFSVSDTTQVYFAHGNLWWAPYGGSPWHEEPGEIYSDPVWYIAFEQFDNFSWGTDPYGQGNGNPYNWYGDIHRIRTTSGRYNNVPTQLDYYELYCWNNGTSDNYGRYIPTNTSDPNLLSGSYVEWGSLGLVNGTSVAGQWRTLKGGPNSEWHYLLVDRTVANGHAQAFASATEGARWAVVRVGGVPGMLIFPDEFTWPASLNNKIPTYINTPLKENNQNIDCWSDDVPDYQMVRSTRSQRGDDQHVPWDTPSMTCEFRQLEMAGFVFLPCVGLREGDGIRYCGGIANPNDGTTGSGWGADLRYYSASPNGDGEAYYMGLKLSGDDRMELIAGEASDNPGSYNTHDRYYGRAVRLVMNVR